MLARILDRTLLRERTRLDDRWLVVDDKVRIHLGTGQVRGDDGDEPRQVRASRGALERAASVFLPFEGDSTLTAILAKAFQLVDD